MLSPPLAAFAAYVDGHFRTVPGAYTLDIGQSERDLPIQLTLTAP